MERCKSGLETDEIVYIVYEDNPTNIGAASVAHINYINTYIHTFIYTYIHSY
jgi:hypothetical protein